MIGLEIVLVNDSPKRFVPVSVTLPLPGDEVTVTVNVVLPLLLAQIRVLFTVHDLSVPLGKVICIFDDWI
jgi:hypothetical protein